MRRYMNDIMESYEIRIRKMGIEFGQTFPVSVVHDLAANA
jgi:hypothetical protein